MRRLSSDLVLKRTTDYSVSLHGDGRVTLFLQNKTVELSEHALSLLSLFSRPCRVDRALDILAPTVESSSVWIEIRDTLEELWRNGLVTAIDSSLPQSMDSDSYSEPGSSIGMINDRARTDSIIKAIREVVQPGDRVIDIGTGTGILAVAAARVGAERVYAIERGGIAQAAQALFIDNELFDKIKLIPADASKVALPVRCDVLVTEMVSNQIVNENLLGLIADARYRLLTPGAITIPSRLRIFALPVKFPNTEFRKHWFSLTTTGAWNKRYGISFRALVQAARDWPHRIQVHPTAIAQWSQLSTPVLLDDLDLSAPAVTGQAEAELVIEEIGELNAMAVYFESQLSPSITLSTAPGMATRECMWRNTLWFDDEPIAVRPGDRLRLSYRYRNKSSELSWKVECED